MDVVYNHTFVGDGSNFSLTVPSVTSTVINRTEAIRMPPAVAIDTASERAMVRRYIVESVKYWAEEYHVDGFRFDLMGIHDVETMNEVKAELAKLRTPSIFAIRRGLDRQRFPATERSTGDQGCKRPETE